MSKVALLINLGSPKSPGVKDVKEYFCLLYTSDAADE